MTAAGWGRTSVRTLGGVVLIVLLVWGMNYVLVGRLIDDALGTDHRNDTYTLAGHYRYFVDPSTLVLDLRRIDGAAPLDLFRGLFQSAKAMHDAERTFTRVELARSGSPVFWMEGSAFGEMGTQFAMGENPVYLVRTLPEKLYRPSGEAAFGTWTGGLLGVALRQMQDAKDAASEWAGN